MRIVSWNVNGIRAISKKGFEDWVKADGPDILCLQETKAQPEQLTKNLLNLEGYAAANFRSAEKKGYSGVVTYSKTEPLRVTSLGVEEFDSEGRVVATAFPGVTVVNAYFPNSQDERNRLPYKLRFCEAITEFCNELVKQGENIVLCGDYNIAHTEIDLARPKQNENSAGYYIEEREAMTEFLSNGYVDTFRHFVKEPEHYSWWSYRGGARARNVGWRIDYHCVNESLMPAVNGAEILPDVMGSDHCPVVVTLDDKKLK